MSQPPVAGVSIKALVFRRRKVVSNRSYLEGRKILIEGNRDQDNEPG